jgi:hypothetical protein
MMAFAYPIPAPLNIVPNSGITDRIVILEGKQAGFLHEFLGGELVQYLSGRGRAVFDLALCRLQSHHN